MINEIIAYLRGIKQVYNSGFDKNEDHAKFYTVRLELYSDGSGNIVVLYKGTGSKIVGFDSILQLMQLVRISPQITVMDERQQDQVDSALYAWLGKDKPNAKD